MSHRRAVLALVAALGLVACAPRGPRPPVAAQPRAEEPVTLLAPPPLSDGIFPCSDCHAGLDVNPERRTLEMHEEIALRHGDREMWCLDCHDPADRDKLRRAGGATVELADAHRLCAQCHGDKHRDWREGVHGKRIGSWSGGKQALVCGQCHPAHAPRFAKIAPLPPAPRPGGAR
jgi:hypothetical protein